jgi:hypothetical protein
MSDVALKAGKGGGLAVMAGLVPAIHALNTAREEKS